MRPFVSTAILTFDSLDTFFQHHNPFHQLIHGFSRFVASTMQKLVSFLRPSCSRRFQLIFFIAFSRRTYAFLVYFPPNSDSRNNSFLPVWEDHLVEIAPFGTLW
ncbi:hypothetical protein CW304_21260 [Bacillus sp. UFRGS-B20]|nr:hypothetical protein CW304_21260 [Bacillus sp. UFRGS-B20]